MSQPRLGCIADDFTGATDLASMLVREGMRVVQVIGVPCEPLQDEADAVVVALKTRTVPAAQAVSEALAARAWLQEQGVSQIYFKYCSTFDSTPAGNIGPVIEALMQALGTDFTIACPALPENGRTVFNGHLFVGNQLLHESSMRHHPLTPMTDSSIVRVLQAQTSRRVGLVDHATVRQGSQAIAARIDRLREEGFAIAVVDAISDDDLRSIAAAAAPLRLISGGSGLALGLPRTRGIAASHGTQRLPAADGLRAIVSGSCSAATLAQVAEYRRRGGEAFAVDPLRAAAGHDVLEEAIGWASPRLQSGPVLIYATAEPAAVSQVQGSMGTAAAGRLVEGLLAAAAVRLVQAGVRQLIVAGGETSGACVQALGIRHLRVGEPIAPGVPWCFAPADGGRAAAIHVALKSGNFGAPGFFADAFQVLD